MGKQEITNDNDKFCSYTRESWEIENRIKMFREAIRVASITLAREVFVDKERADLEKALHILIKGMQDFENVRWVVKK